MLINDLPIELLKALLFTIIIEVMVALLMKVRGKKNILNVVLVNMITNPLLNIILFLICYYLGNKYYYIILFLLELLVYISEAYMYNKVKVSEHYILLSIICNTCSLLLGFVII